MLKPLRALGVLLATTVAATLLLIVPAAAEEDPSVIENVTPTVVEQGQLITVTLRVFNWLDYGPVTNGSANLYGGFNDETTLLDVTDLVSCAGDVVGPCGIVEDLGYAAPVGTVAALTSRTVVFTLRVTTTAPVGDFYLRHQFVGDNFGAPTLLGPIVTITQRQVADIAVTLAATITGVSTVEYAATATNLGPATATGVTVTMIYPAGLTFVASPTCALAGTRTVRCAVGTVAVGAATTARFTARAGVLLFGSFTTTAARTASAPSDSNAANDQTSRTCSALTGLIVSC